MAEDLGERTEEPTPRRRQQAREDGQVAKSQDLSGAMLLLLVTLAVWFAAMPTFEGLGAVLRDALGASEVTVDSLGEVAAALGHAAVGVALPLLLVAWLVALVVNMMQTGILFAPKRIAPNIKKLSPIEGVKRIAGPSALVKVSLDTLKVAIVVTVGALTAWQYAEEIVVLPYLTAWQGWARIGAILFDLALRVAAVLVVLGVLDYAYQRWRHLRDLRMTRQQVKDELKQTEGDPDVRKRRLRMQQQITMQRIAAAVPKADVVVTNPEHLAIAIRYDSDTMAAPTVTAKGADSLAARIRTLAAEHGVPVIERKPLARALYKQVPVGGMIPSDLYAAVAEILAYVYRLSGRTALG